MKWIDLIVKMMFAIFGVTFLHMLFIYWLPYPVNHVHIILIATVLIIFLYEHGSIVWLSLVWYIFLEYLSATPFGIILFSGVIATFVMYIAYKEVLTNRSLISSILLFTVGYGVYRAVYIILYVFWALYTPNIDVTFLAGMTTYLLEWICTTAVLSTMFILIRQISRELKRQHIEESWFKHLGS